MEDLYLGWIEQLSRALDYWGKVAVDISPRTIVVTGMGGSGIVGDYVRTLSEVYGSKAPVIVVKDYKLPRHVTKNDLVFVVSYSGNTIETLKTFKEALERGSKIVVVSSDGMLIEEAEKRGIPYVKVVEGIAPRTALPEMLYGILGVLDASNLSIISREDAVKAYNYLKDHVKDAVNESYNIALFINKHSRNLIIAAHTPYEALAVRAKNEFNENSKIPAKVEVMPEWAHNDIVGWERPYSDEWCVLSIVDKGDHIRVKMMEFMEEIYRLRGYPIYRVELSGGILENLLYGSLVVGLASVKLARLRNIEPMETRYISKYKSFIRAVMES